MNQPLSFVRPATLLDMLGVATAMRQTLRGQNELKTWEIINGPVVDERFIAQLFSFSQNAVALVPKENPGRAMVCAGFLPQRPGVLRTWMLATDEAWRGYATELTTYTKLGIVNQLAGAHRIETWCPDSHTAAKAWYPSVGLKQEATLAKYCSDGSDAAVFVALRGKS
jgi:hypothetical protein